MTMEDQPTGRLAVVVALAAGATTDEAAAQGSVSGTTVRRWLRTDKDFANEVRQARAELLQRALGLLSEGAVAAVLALRKLLEAESESVRARAASTILTTLITVRDSVDLERRVTELEAAVAQGEGITA
ncbi:hypothetical protein [Streptomyces sp. 1222.5]|uniref:hypothetical protein n=1 Tax=Streptomyces sp. 1222.5 TaxID=1881026 RepID=UPI003D72DF27